MTTITLDPQSPGSTAPYIDILAESFDPGTDTVTVWRTAGGRSFRVRGLVGVSAAGTVTIRDFEAGTGVESSYRVEQFDSAGDFIAWSDSEVAELPDTAPYAWFHNPLDPSTAVKVRMLNGAAGVLAREVDAEQLRPIGRSVGVAYFGARRGLGRVVLDCIVETEADADAFDALFGGYDDVSTVPILCIRTPPAMRLPPTLFALIGIPEQIPLDFAGGGEATKWALLGDEIAPPPEAIVTSLLGYDDFTAFYSDYAAFTAAYPDYRDATRDYTIAGTA